MINILKKFVKKLLHFNNAVKINVLGNGTQLHCKVEKRNINSIIKIGDRCLINGRLVTENANSSIIIKNNVFIGGKTILDCLSLIEVNDNVLISYECIIADHDSHSISSAKRQEDLNRFRDSKMNWSDVNTKPIIIKKNAWIGTRSIILKGVTIGEGSIVAAGSVVTTNVPNYTLVAGNPAIVKKRLN